MNGVYMEISKAGQVLFNLETVLKTERIYVIKEEGC